MKLKSTGQEVVNIPSMRNDGQTWPKGMYRIMIPNPNGENHIQYVRKHMLDTKS